MRTILVPVPSGFQELFERAIRINSMTLIRGGRIVKSTRRAILPYLLQTLSWAETLRTCARLTVVQEKEGNRCRPDDHVRSPASGSQWVAVTPWLYPGAYNDVPTQKGICRLLWPSSVLLSIWLCRGSGVALPNPPLTPARGCGGQLLGPQPPFLVSSRRSLTRLALHWQTS